MAAKFPNKFTRKKEEDAVQRISISLPSSVFRELDQLITERGLESRSKAVADMVTQFALKHQEEKGVTIMAGTITVVYDVSTGTLLQRLAELQRYYIDEVISSLHVQLENDHRMEVLLVQGPVERLKEIVNKLVSIKGVKTGKLSLSAAIMPPIHPLPASYPKSK
jgi:CopG family transcriptional regulator, nickel-responsive regulator